MRPLVPRLAGLGDPAARRCELRVAAIYLLPIRLAANISQVLMSPSSPADAVDHLLGQKATHSIEPAQ